MAHDDSGRPCNRVSPTNRHRTGPVHSVAPFAGLENGGAMGRRHVPARKQDGAEKILGRKPAGHTVSIGSETVRARVTRLARPFPKERLASAGISLFPRHRLELVVPARWIFAAVFHESGRPLRMPLFEPGEDRPVSALEAGQIRRRLSHYQRGIGLPVD